MISYWNINDYVFSENEKDVEGRGSSKQTPKRDATFTRIKKVVTERWLQPTEKIIKLLSKKKLNSDKSKNDVVVVC